MKQFIKLSVLSLIFTLLVFGGSKKNGRYIINEDDFQSSGGLQRFKAMDTLMTDAVHMMKSAHNTATWSACSVNVVSTDTIENVTVIDAGAGGVSVDTLTGVKQIVSGAGGVDLDTLTGVDKMTAINVDLDTLLFAPNEQGRSEYGILKTSKVTIGHPGETTTDLAFTSAANTTEQTLACDTIPAYARILDVWIVTTEAVAGITTSFTVDIGDGAGTDEWATATDIKAANAGIGSDANEALLLMPITTATVIFVNATPAAENWDAMTGGEFSLYVTYLDYGSIK